MTATVTATATLKMKKSATALKAALKDLMRQLVEALAPPVLLALTPSPNTLKNACSVQRDRLVRISGLRHVEHCYALQEHSLTMARHHALHVPPGLTQAGPLLLALPAPWDTMPRWALRALNAHLAVTVTSQELGHARAVRPGPTLCLAPPVVSCALTCDS